MFYTYVIESIGRPEKKYVGYTADLQGRLATHNSGGCRYTRGARPWRIRAYFAFRDIEIARGFEQYLKSGSGRAFAKRHLF
ncbi:MAG: GIY-YIG nuclease family protein [Deltaproteobacteria bacterium]|nr:GIY-YIG nuclease family protein [Deltaproteobacteria bacterium]